MNLNYRLLFYCGIKTIFGKQKAKLLKYRLGLQYWKIRVKIIDPAAEEEVLRRKIRAEKQAGFVEAAWAVAEEEFGAALVSILRAKEVKEEFGAVYFLS